MWWRMAAFDELVASSPQGCAPLMAATEVHVHLSVTVAGGDDSGEKDYRTYHSQFGSTGASGVMPADEDGDIKAGVLNDSASAKLHSKALSKQLQADAFYAASLHTSSLKANPSDQHRLSIAYGRRNIHNVAKISAIHDNLAASSTASINSRPKHPNRATQPYANCGNCSTSASIVPNCSISSSIIDSSS